MAAPGKPSGSGSGSGWGSFLSQAVGGLESRLDNMLTEGEEAERQRKQGIMPAASNKPAPQPATKPAPKPSRVNDRLQARLAKAMAAKNTPTGGSPRSSIDQPSPASSVRDSIDKDARPSIDASSAKDASETSESKPTTPAPADEAVAPAPSLATTPSTPAQGAATSPGDGQIIVKKEPAKEGMPDFSKPTPAATVNNDVSDATPKIETATEATAGTRTETKLESQDRSKVVEEAKPLEAPTKDTDKDINKKQEPEKPTEISRPDADQSAIETSQTNEGLEATKARHQEEVQEYVERIDALQAKLQYLSKSSIEASKKSKAAAPSGSMDRKLAEKDEKIALLMEEGQKLSTSEGKYRTTIRKLRAQAAESEKQIDDLKKAKEKAAAEVESMRDNLNSNEEQEKQNEEVRKVSTALQKEIDALKRENSAKDEAYRRLERETKAKLEQTELSSLEALKKAVGTEQRKQKELEDTIVSLRKEIEAQSDKTRLDSLEWQEKLDRAAERNHNMEEELKLELRASDSKLEAMRVAAEEASSGTGGESQIKLIRQIETLQSQYASASNNWQGIEASLLTKVSSLEKEKDEAQRRESEMRKKARDSASRCRHLEDELQDVTPALATAQQELETCREQLATLRTQSKTTETALEQARAGLEKQQRSGSFAAESERRQWGDDSMSKSHSRPESPMLSVPRNYSSDLVGLPVPGRPPRRAPTPGSNPDSVPEGMLFARRLSNQPPLRTNTLSTLGSAMPPPPLSPFEPLSESPRATSPPPDRDDDLDSSAPRNIAHDMISVSTTGAGPSVQLVERMSAAIRRLEAEKVAAKEEMSRVCSQRDEARSDMVGLMKDLEEAKSATAKVAELETEMENINSRYQTTLELLGEKSELVEELKADVQDVKAMYRDLVERTVK